MTDTCLNCDGEILPENARAAAEGFTHHPHCPPKVEFFPEVVCVHHKRCTPGSANCADPPCRDRHYQIDGERIVNGQEIVSVTSVTKEVGDTFGQGAWWGMGVGVKGALALTALGKIPREPTQDNVVPLLTKHKLTTNHTRDDAASRGTAIHDVAEKWANEKVWVEAETYPEEQRGYIRALYSFIETEKPQPAAAEVLVGSRRGAYAGTFDLLAVFPKLDSIGLIDFKTKSKPLKGKSVAYEQHHLQLAGYEAARREMEMEPTDFQAVVNLYPDGQYAIVQGRATSQQWQDALAAYRSLTSLRTAIREAA